MFCIHQLCAQLAVFVQFDGCCCLLWWKIQFFLDVPSCFTKKELTIVEIVLFCFLKIRMRCVANLSSASNARKVSIDLVCCVRACMWWFSLTSTSKNTTTQFHHSRWSVNCIAWTYHFLHLHSCRYYRIKTILSNIHYFYCRKVQSLVFHDETDNFV